MCARMCFSPSSEVSVQAMAGEGTPNGIGLCCEVVQRIVIFLRCLAGASCSYVKLITVFGVQKKFSPKAYRQRRVFTLSSTVWGMWHLLRSSGYILRKKRPATAAASSPVPSIRSLWHARLWSLAGFNIIQFAWQFTGVTGWL